MLGNCVVQRVQLNNLVVAEVGAASSEETSVAVPGCEVGDIGYFVCEQEATSGIVYNGARCAVAGTMLLRFSNPTAAPITPTPTNDYKLFIFKAQGQVQTV